MECRPLISTLNVGNRASCKATTLCELSLREFRLTPLPFHLLPYEFVEPL